MTSKIHLYYIPTKIHSPSRWIHLGELDLENHSSQHHNREMGGSCEPTGYKVHTILCASGNQDNV